MRCRWIWSQRRTSGARTSSPPAFSMHSRNTNSSAKSRRLSWGARPVRMQLFHPFLPFPRPVLGLGPADLPLGVLRAHSAAKSSHDESERGETLHPSLATSGAPTPQPAHGVRAEAEFCVWWMPCRPDRCSDLARGSARRDHQLRPLLPFCGECRAQPFYSLQSRLTLLPLAVPAVVPGYSRDR